MSIARVLPLLILILMVGGITLFFLNADPPPPEETNSAAGPLVRLAPVLRGLEATADGEVRAIGLVDGVLEQYTRQPREAILEALREPEWGARWAGLLAVPRYGESDPALAEAIRPLLSAETTRVRATAAAAAAYVGASFALLRPGLETACGDEEAAVRAAALGTLARRARPDPALVDLFAAHLDDPSDRCRAAAARGIARVELQERLDPEALTRVRARLSRALGDESREVRMYAAMALGRAGSAAAPDVPALLPLLRDPDPLVSGQAATALGSIGEAALPAIEDALREAPIAVVQSLLWSLRLMEAPAVPLLRRLLQDERALVGVLAAQKLLEIERDDASASRTLVEALASEDATVLLASIRVMDRMGTGGAENTRALERLRAHVDERVRTAAAGALARLRTTGAGAGK